MFNTLGLRLQKQPQVAAFALMIQEGFAWHGFAIKQAVIVQWSPFRQLLQVLSGNRHYLEWAKQGFSTFSYSETVPVALQKLRATLESQEERAVARCKALSLAEYCL